MSIFYVQCTVYYAKHETNLNETSKNPGGGTE